MKKFVLWMIRVFKLDIPTEKIVTKVVEKQVLIPENGVIERDLLVKGHVTVKGSLDVEGNLVVYKDATCKLIVRRNNYGKRYNSNRKRNL